ncbi:NACHT domain-containing protein [Vibrio fluvialis]|nr:NACHT domain-containing protein [Vibrio fluvialis]MBY8170864.1 NACHT domain-containing protein [Vibrio fluvialis]
MLNTNLSSSHKALIIIFIVSILTTLSVFYVADKVSAIIISMFSLLFVWIIRSLWIPKKCGKTQVRLYSLYISSLIIAASSYPIWSDLLIYYFKPLIIKSDIDPLINLLDTNNGNILTSPIMIFTIIVIFIVNRKLSDSDSMGKSLDSFDRDIPEPEFKERLKHAIDALRDDLRSINKQTNWTGSFFTDLEAEIFIKKKGGHKRKVSSLIKALKEKKGRAFLVLGDPGSGKSVALRTLAIDLLDQVKDANKIPLYINLKEWSNTNWSEDAPPTDAELLSFVKDNIARRDLALNNFVDKYFDRLYETRRFFFIFDSFDEIPQVMNVEDNSLLIDELSKVLYRFIKDNNNISSGIVASRFFRKPTSNFNASSEIEIRPFKGEQIATSLRKTSNATDEIINSIFIERRDLYITAKNPFMSSMISKFIDVHNSLPKNQLEMFDVFINYSLENANRKLKESKISKIEIINASKEIALVMFSDFGLEAPVNELKARLPQYNIEKVIDCLKFSRLVRSSSVDEGRVSFVHRRFCEYFVVLDLLENHKEVPFDDIPKDSQWRDALVLYCEVAAPKYSQDIAKKCWNIIKSDNGKGSIEAIHCIRFLRDAFKSRPDSIEDIRNEIEEFISNEIGENKIVYWNKFVIELLCLVQDSTIEKNVLTCLSFKDSWIFETAIESCRHLPKVSKGLIQEITSYIDDKSEYDFISNLKSYKFNFSISEAFKPIKNYISTRYIELILMSFVTLYFLITHPIPTLSTLLFLIVNSIFLYLATKLGLLIPSSRIHSSWIINHIKKILPKRKEDVTKELSNLIGVRVKKTIDSEGLINFTSRFYEAIRSFIVAIPLILAYLYILDVFVFTYFTDNKSKLQSDIHEALTTFSEIINLSTSDHFFISSIYALSFFPYFRLRIFSGKKIHTTNISLVFIFPIAALALITLISFYTQVFLWIMSLTYLVVIIVLIPSLIKTISFHIKCRKKYKSIDINTLNTREKIYSCIRSLDENKFYTKKLLDKLDINASSISGEWPNTDILVMKNNRFASQLCQMDVRWRKIN